MRKKRKSGKAKDERRTQHGHRSCAYLRIMRYFLNCALPCSSSQLETARFMRVCCLASTMRLFLAWIACILTYQPRILAFCNTHEIKIIMVGQQPTDTTLRGHFGFIFKAHCRVRNVSCVGVLYVYAPFSFDFGSCVTSKSGHDAHGDGHGHVPCAVVYAPLRNLRHPTYVPRQPKKTTKPTV